MGPPAGPYQAQILEHYKHPHNRGLLEPATHRGRESNPLCGDDITLSLRVDGSDRIEEVRFDGEGCAISMASASLLTEAVKGKTLGDAATLDKAAVLANLGVPLSAVREQCALLALRALKRALGPGTTTACPECGAAIQPGGRRCAQCGHVLTPAGDVNPPNP